MTKVFTLTAIMKVLRKKTSFNQNTNFFHISRSLNISVALYGLKKFIFEIGHQRQVGQYQLAKRKKKFNFRFEWMIYLPVLHMDDKISKNQRVQKPRWATPEW